MTTKLETRAQPSARPRDDAAVESLYHVTQDAFLAAFRNQASWRGDGPREAWLMRIVVNAALAAGRRRRVRLTEVLDDEAHAADDHAAGSAARLSVLAALQGLPPKERAAVVLRYYHDCDYAKIARCLSTSSGTVGSWLTRAVARLRAQLGGSTDAR